jgi:small subunit ribosomal protein S14
MAKESMKAREVKRKTVAKYAERKALLEAGDFVGLQKLPKTLHLFVYTTDVNYR